MSAAIRSQVSSQLKDVPGLYRYGKEKVTNKTLKKALESDANYVAEQVEENLFGLVKKMSRRISNL